MMNVFFRVILLSAVLFIGCSDMTPAENEESKSSVSGVINSEPEFYSSGNSGKWKEQEQTHTPVIEFIDADRIRVRVPLTPSKNPRHYIQAIALMHGKKEISIKRFKFSLLKAIAEFDLPKFENSCFSVIIKCNKHGMWKEQVRREKI